MAISLTAKTKDHKPASHRRVRGRHIAIGVIVLIVAGLIAGRIYLHTWLLDHVNNVLKNIPGYTGSVKDIDIHLYRGAYRIHELELRKKTGNIPTPFLSIDTTDLSIQWGALLHGRVVSDVDLVKPVITFAVNKSGTAAQTGTNVDWNKPIRDLMPIDINLVTFKDGKLSYQDFSTSPKVNLFITDMSGEVRNLRNVVEKDKPLPSSLVIKGDSIGKGAVEIKGHMNVLKPIIDMDIDGKLEKVQLQALNDYSTAYAGVTIKGGTLNVYTELKVKDGRISGYVKPMATGVDLIDLRKTSNPIQLAWEVVVASVVEIFTNQPNDQFATKIPLSGHVDNISVDSFEAFVGIIRNAFFEAVRRGFDGGEQSDKDLDKLEEKVDDKKD